MTDIFIKTVEMSAEASIVICVIIVLRLALKKAPKVFFYVMWAAALFRLLCPVSFEFTAAPVPKVEIPYSETVGYENVNDLFITYSDRSNLSVPENTEPQRSSSEQLTEDSETNSAKISFKKQINYLAIASYIWALAVLFMALRGVISWIKLSRSLKSAQKAGENVYVSAAISDPFIMGIVRPKIYLPVGLNCTETLLIVRHEKAHMHRGDHIAKLVMYAALCIHCFNPLVWIMFRLFERDMEMSCDERVTADMTKEEKADYSETLLKISAKPAAKFTACFGENGTKQRVKNVLSFKKPAVWIMIILAFAAVGITVVLCVSRNKSDSIISDNTDTTAESFLALGENGITGYVKAEDDFRYSMNAVEKKYKSQRAVITDEDKLDTLYEAYYFKYGENVYNCTFYEDYYDIPLYDESFENVVDYFRVGYNTTIVPPEDSEFFVWKDSIELIPLTEERQNAVYSDSFAPEMLYADNYNCLFTDGIGGLYLYNFGDKEILMAVDFLASMEQANSDISDEDDQYGGASIYSRIKTFAVPNEKNIYFAFETKGKEKQGGEFGGRYYYLDVNNSRLELTGTSSDALLEKAVTETIDREEQPDAISSLYACINKHDYVYIADSGAHVSEGESQLPMIRLVKNINGKTECFDPFENETSTVTTTEAIVMSELQQSVQTELSDFIPPEYTKLSESDWVTVNWDDTELTALYDEAVHIRTYYFEFLYSPYFDRLGVQYDTDGNSYERSGIKYASFENYLNGIFTEEYTDKLLCTEPTAYKDINDELCYRDVNGSGSDPALDSVSLSIEERTADKIIIKETARYCHPDTPDEEYYRDFNCTILMTDNGWRVDDLELWY